MKGSCYIKLEVIKVRPYNRDKDFPTVDCRPCVDAQHRLYECTYSFWRGKEHVDVGDIVLGLMDENDLIDWRRILSHAFPKPVPLKI